MELFCNLVYEYGVFAMLFMVFLEYACFPVSSEIILPLSGAIAAGCGWPYFLMVICCSLAGLLGTYLVFFVSYKASSKISAKLRSDNKVYQKCVRLSSGKGKFAICISRVIPLCRTYIAIPLGIAKINHLEYLLWSFIGIAAWNSVLLAAGYALGSNWNSVSYYYSQYKTAILIVIIASIFSIGFFKAFSRFRQRLRTMEIKNPS